MIKLPGLVLLDARGLLMHAYHRGTDPDAKFSETTNKLINGAGFGLGVFIETYLTQILRDFAPLNVVAVWDGGNDYRKGLFAEYKAKRHQREKDPAQEAQYNELFKMAKGLLAYCGAFNVQVAGTEADDVIAAFVERCPEVHKLVYTVDADLLQLTSDSCTVLLRGEPVEDFEGYPLEFVRLNKSIVGDSSDGYGGVPGVGPVAFKYLFDTFGADGLQELEACVRDNDFGPLEEAHAQTGSKILLRLLEHRGTWRNMYRLASLHPWLCHRGEARKIIRPEWYVRLPDRSKVLTILTMAGNPDLIDLFDPHLPTTTLADNFQFQATKKHFIESLPDTPFIPFDYESYDELGHDWKPALPATTKSYVDVISQRLTGLSMSYGSNLQHTFYVPTLHRDTENVDEAELADLFVEAEDAGLDFVAHNARFEETLTRKELKFAIDGPVDTMILASYVDENDSKGLKDQALQWFRYNQTHFKELMDQYGAKDMRDLSGEEVLDYGCDDSVVCGRLMVLQWLILHLENQWQFAYEEDRFTLHPFNRGFEMGVRIDYVEMARLAAADAETAKVNMEDIRALLTEHCSGINEIGALELKKADGANLVKMHRDGGLNQSQAEAKLVEQYERWRLASAYRPYVERHEAAPFLPTPKAMSKMAAKIGLPIELEKDTAKCLTAWLVASSNYLSQKAELGEEVNPLAQQFVDLVGDASGEIKKREGLAYEALKQFAEQRILFDEGRLITEGDELNLGSFKQMQELLYCKLQLPVRLRAYPQKGSGRDKLGLEGNPGTDEEAISMALAEDCPIGDWRRVILQKLLETKECMTRKSLYYNKYPHWKHPTDGVIHPSTKNCGTVTRRPAGGAPNILAVSKGPLRAIYIPRFKRHVIASLDFIGQELRLTGSSAKDPVLIEGYTSGGTYMDDGMVRTRYKDIHSLTACTFAGRLIEQELGAAVLQKLAFDETGSMDYELFLSLLTEGDHVFEMVGDLALPLGAMVVKLRKMAKTANFLIIYGGQAFSMAMKLGVPERIAQAIIDRIYAGYPRLGPWQKEVIETAKRQGYITTAYGTRKHVSPDIFSRDNSLRARAERQTVNHEIQGCAADILKKALTAAHHQRLYEETHSYLIAPVYDELTNSVPIDSVFEFIERAQDCMNICPPGHAIPMLASVSLGRNWYDASQNELGDRPSQGKVEALFDKWAKEGWLQ